MSQLELKNLSWPGLVQLGDKFKILARLGLGSKASGISDISSARARKEVGCLSLAWLGLNIIHVLSWARKKIPCSIHPVLIEVLPFCVFSI